jgi:hypothetical protein
LDLSLKDRIYEFIKSRSIEVSLIELQRNFPEFDGNIEWEVPEKNIVYWFGMSEKFVIALNELVNDRKINVKPVDPNVYTLDGIVIWLPIAKRPNHSYKKPRWLPITLLAST